MECTQKITANLLALGIPNEYLQWISDSTIAFPGYGNGTVGDLADFSYRNIVSLAIRRGIQTKLGLSRVPPEGYAWEKTLHGITITPETRKSAVGPIRVELQATGFSEKLVNTLETTKIAAPGDPPGDLSNLVDYCSKKLSAPPGDA
jgi:hypothetical protein